MCTQDKENMKKKQNLNLSSLSVMCVFVCLLMMMMMMMRRFVKRVLNSPQRRCQSIKQVALEMSGAAIVLHLCEINYVKIDVYFSLLYFEPFFVFHYMNNKMLSYRRETALRGAL